MRVRELRIEGVRNLVPGSIDAGDRVNFFLGLNGAGKTSVLEALHCLALGRSFRAGGRHSWLNRELGQASIFAATDGHRLGVRQDRQGWEGRIDGAACQERARFSSLLPLFLYHPDSHALVDGEPLHRRRLVDQGVFHVEHGFLSCWRRFRRSLAQRNAALRSGVNSSSLVAWEAPLAEAGEALNSFRERYVGRLHGAVSAVVGELEIRIPELSLALHTGWAAGEPLADALARSRASDQERGFTQLGPQRADLRIRDADGVVGGRLSRGQQKLVAMALLLAQARLFAEDRAAPPLFLLDDVGSELDEDHERRVGSWLARAGWQVWLTGLSVPDWMPSGDEAIRMFHVEQGRISIA